MLTDSRIGVEQQHGIGIDQRQGPAGAITAPSSVTVPGTLEVTAHPPTGQQAEVTGFVVLTSGSESRRLPFWLRIEAPQLPRQKHGALKKNGTYKGNTRGRPSLVGSYRYPENPAGVGVPAELGGPEQVFTVQLAKPVANFGVAILSQAQGVSIQPRVVADDDENRLTGYPALPINLNPYVVDFYKPTPAAGAILPDKGTYDVVFDSTNSGDAGKFTFRFWINDVKPPTATLLTRTVKPSGFLRIKVTDSGSGVDPSSLSAAIDTSPIRPSYSRTKNRVTIPVPSLSRGTHRLFLQVSDYEETRNMEDVGPILPNTRTLSTTFRVK